MAGFVRHRKNSGRGGGSRFAGMRIRFNRGGTITLSSDLTQTLRDRCIARLELLIDRDTRRVALEPADPEDGINTNGYVIQYAQDNGSCCSISSESFLGEYFVKEVFPITFDASWGESDAIIFSIPSRVWREKLTS